MIILNVNEINEIDSRRNFSQNGQPREYNSEEELIEWLKYDLYQQSIYNRKTPNEDNIITIEDEEEKDYVLNIAGYNYTLVIKYSFNLVKILQVLKKDHKLFCRFNCYNIHFYESALFVNTMFFNTANFKRITLEIGWLVFTDSVFYGDIYFSFLYADMLNFYNLHLYKKISISSIFFRNNSFILLQFCVGENTQILVENIQSSFENTKIIIRTLGKLNEFYIDSININGNCILDLATIGIYVNNINKNTYIDIFNCKYDVILNKEMATILKMYSYEKYNYIEALEYQAEEVILHKEELFQKWSENKNLKTFGDIISINLSSLFSDNGVNWIKALGMTIIMSTSFFLLSYLPNTFPIFIYAMLSFSYMILYKSKAFIFTLCSLITYITLSIYINYNLCLIVELFNFFNPTSFSQLGKESYIYKFKYPLINGLLYFLGKIAFWYGSFHTVSAFRKFNRSL